MNAARGGMVATRKRSKMMADVTSEKATCPRCGAEEFDTGHIYASWQCGTSQMHQSGAVEQSRECRVRTRLNGRIAELEAELARYKNPTEGDVKQQAAAWSAVYAALEQAGMLSHYSASGRGRDRAVEFVRHMAEQLAELREAIHHIKVDAELERAELQETVRRWERLTADKGEFYIQTSLLRTKILISLRTDGWHVVHPRNEELYEQCFATPLDALAAVEELEKENKTP